MEVEIKPISLDERLEYVQQISENQKTNANNFPWLIAIGAFFIGGVLAVAIIRYRNRRYD